MSNFDVSAFRLKFPLLAVEVHQKSLIYFDNGATTQKPQCVIDSYQQYYANINANVHRASHALSASATHAFEQARTKAKTFINASKLQEIIWTKGTTEAVNLIAQSWGRSFLSPGDEIVLSQCEHHANIVPWQMLTEQTGAVIKIIPLTNEGVIDISSLDNIVNSATKIVSVCHISNVLGRINPIEKIIAKAKEVGAISVIDGAQAIAHEKVDVQTLDCDFYVFSAHKMYGPTGLGVLYGRKEILDVMPPYQTGGEMIKSVSFEQTTYNELPFKFEAGTPNIAAVLAFSVTIDFLLQNFEKGIKAYENSLVNYCFQQLKTVSRLNFIVTGSPDIPIFSFTIKGCHNQDIATSLDSYGIAVRSGHHCAMPLMSKLGLDGCIRVSLSSYNTFEEVDYFIESLTLIIACSEKSHHDGENIISRAISNEQIMTECENSHLSVTQLIDVFSQLKSWDSKHREIMMLGKNFTRLAKEQRNDQTLIAGCESLAWLKSTKSLKDVYKFEADSDAKIIRGLLAIVLAAFNNKTFVQIDTFDINLYFEQLGLLHHLSPSRGNGLRAIVNKIKLIVATS